jgi:hypothetical protein
VERSLAAVEVDGDGSGRPIAHGSGMTQGQRQLELVAVGGSSASRAGQQREKVTVCERWRDKA